MGWRQVIHTRYWNDSLCGDFSERDCNAGHEGEFNGETVEKAGTLPNDAFALRATIKLKAFGLLLLLGIIYALRPLVVVRFGTLIAGRLGHLAANTECYLCEKDVGLSMPKRVFDIWTPGEPANSYLLKMYERVIFTWHSSIPGILREAAKFLDWWHEHEFGNASMGRDIFNLFEQIPSHISFTPEEEKWGEEGLLEMGIPKAAKWVCLIVRDSAYLGQDFAYHHVRDSDVKSYKKAALALAERGYYVVRMGSVVEKQFQVEHPKIIDYATNGMRSEFMDIYLGAHCSFCLSNATGFDAIPMVFRKPICFVNVVPVEYLQTYLKDSIAIWKRHYKNGKRMSFKEIIDSGAGRFLKSQDFMDAKIKLEDNSPNEIMEVALEMADLIEGLCNSLDEHEFWSSYPRSDSPYTGMPLHGRINMRVGSRFLTTIGA